MDQVAHTLALVDVDRRTISIDRRVARVRSPWLFQILVRLTLARLDGDHWVALDDLASLDGTSCRTSEIAGRKLSELRNTALTGCDVSAIVDACNDEPTKGPYRLALTVSP